MPRLTPLLSVLLGLVASTSACDIPTEPLSNNIPESFRVLLQNTSIPEIHNRFMNVWAWDTSDQHLFLSPYGNYTNELFLQDGVLHWPHADIRGVIQGEFNEFDETTKLFMTNRAGPEAIFEPVYTCNPDTDELQIELRFVGRAGDPPGGYICVRPAFQIRHEFRYSPPGVHPLDPVQPCMEVTLVVFRGDPDSVVSGGPGSLSDPPPPVGDYDFVSCWSEPDGGRALSVGPMAADDMTNEKCAELCDGYRYMGTEWNVECFCGMELAGDSSAPLLECNYPCIGNASQYCGGTRKLSLYQNMALPDSSSTTTTTTNPSATETASPDPDPTETSTSEDPTTTPTPLPAIGEYDYVSCWSEPDGGRALSEGPFAAEDMTNEMCAELCSTRPYFGTEWNRECFCGGSLAAGSGPAPESECDHPCFGDDTQMCGGSRRLSLYHNPNLQGPSHPDVVDGFSFYGCVVDSVASRTLSDDTMADPGMTPEMCAAFCEDYTYFGMEYSVECFCGASGTDLGAPVDESECGMSCGGDHATLCGDSNRLSVYQKLPPV